MEKIAAKRGTLCSKLRRSRLYLVGPLLRLVIYIFSVEPLRKRWWRIWQSLAARCALLRLPTMGGHALAVQILRGSFLCDECNTMYTPSQGIALLASRMRMSCDDDAFLREDAIDFVQTMANSNGHLTLLNSEDILKQARSRDGKGFHNPQLGADLLCTLEMYSNKSEVAAAMISQKYDSRHVFVKTAQFAVDEAYKHVKFM